MAQTRSPEGEATTDFRMSSTVYAVDENSHSIDQSVLEDTPGADRHNGSHEQNDNVSNHFLSNGKLENRVQETDSKDVKSNGETVIPESNETSKPAPPAIAIVGIGLRLPGGIHSTEAFWDLLVNKKETRCLVPKTRYNIDGFYNPEKKTGSVASQYGHFLAESDNLDAFDTSFFTMSKAEAEQLDPQQRMLLEVVWECMENGGQTGWRGQNIGVFLGTFNEVCPPKNDPYLN